MTDTQNTINKIKERGYWEVNIHPTEYKEKIVDQRSKVKDVIRNSMITIRGWNYPHFSDTDGEPYIVDNGIQKEISWEGHIELWRMTQSGNFYHLRALKEDSLSDPEYNNLWSRGDELKGKKLLGALNTLYTLCEIFEFTRRLINEGVYQDKVVINIKLHNIYERHLFVDAPQRIPFLFARVSRSQKPWTWTVEQKVSNYSEVERDLILKAYLDLTDLFGWENPPVDAFKDDISKFLEGKI